MMRMLYGFLLGVLIGVAGCAQPDPPVPAYPVEASAQRHEEAKALYAKGIALQRKRQTEEAIRHFYLAIDVAPDFAPALNHLAWLRATNPDPALRDGLEAVRLAEQAVAAVRRQDPGSREESNCLDTLAAAYAEAGDFDQAVQAIRQAVALARKINQRSQARDFHSREQRYLEGKTFREVPIGYRNREN